MREYKIQVSYTPKTFCECRKRAQQSIRIRLPLTPCFSRGQWVFNTLNTHPLVYQQKRVIECWILFKIWDKALFRMSYK